MTEPTPQNLLKAPKRQAKTNIKEWILIQTHINTNNTDFTYTNTTDLGQNIFVTGTGGAGNINTSTYDSGHTRYYNKGAVGVALQIFVDDTLCESISGGDGNIVSVADIYKHVRTENHRRKYSCGFLGLKTCWRDNWVQIWEWGHNRQSVTHRAEGQTKSFVLNIPPQSTLKVKFVGSSDSEFKGSVSISLLDNPLSIPFKPIDLSGLEGLVEKTPEPESPEVEPSPKPPETELPEVDSNEKPDDTEQNLPALSREQILAYQSFLSDFMQFFTNNQNQKITENMTFLDYYNANKSEANEPYESFLSSQLMANGGSIVMRDFLADFMQSTESELQEFFANMPQTQHKDGDLLDLSYFELIALLENEQGGDSSQENTENENPPIVEPESPQEQEPTISVEKREKAKAIVTMFDEFKSFWINNKTHTAKIGRFTMTLEQFHYRQTNGDLTPPYDEFVTYFLESQSLSNAWTFFHHASVELGEIFAKVPDTWVDGENLLELTYPQLLEIANGGVVVG